VTAYLQELSALKAVLFRLEEISRNDELLSSLAASRSPLLLDMDIKGCELEVKAIHDKLVKRLSGKKLSRTLSKLTWPFAEQDTRRFIETFQRYRSIFHTALSCDTLSVSAMPIGEYFAV
jgi:hypothetical protein